MTNQAENLSLQIAQIAKDYGNLLDFVSKEKKKKEKNPQLLHNLTVLLQWIFSPHTRTTNSYTIF